MKKLVVSPAQAQNQTIAIVITIDVSPWPATAPPRITAVSPGKTSPTKAPVSRNASSADQHVGPVAELRREVLEQLLDVDVGGELLEGEERRHRPTPTIRTRRPRLRFSPSSCIRGLSEPLRRRDDRVRVAGRQRRRRGVGGGQVGEQPDRRRAGAADQRARSAPTSSSAASASAICGRSEIAACSRSLTSSSRVVERRGAARRPPRAAARSSSSSSAAERAVAERVGLRVDLGRSRRPSSSAISTTANSPGVGSGSIRSPAPADEREARDRAATARRPRARRRARRARRPRPPASRRTAAASALPPPSPAATGIRFSISTRTGAWRQPRARIASSATATRFGPLDPGADDLVGLAGRRRPTSIRSASRSGQNSERSSCRPSSRRAPT